MINKKFNKSQFSFFFLLIFISGYLWAANEVKILEQSRNELKLQISFQEPQIIEYENFSRVEIPGLPLLQESGKPVVPYLTKMISLAGTGVYYSIEKIVKKEKSCANYLILNTPEMIDMDGAVQHTTELNHVDIEYQGLFRKLPLFNITFFPVKVDVERQKLIWIENITLTIKSVNKNQNINFIAKNYTKNEKRLLDKLVSNGNQIDFSSSGSEHFFKNTNQYQKGRFKIFVNENGLYQVSYEDLEEAGMELENSDPGKFKLYNKGKEIPILVETGADGSFDPGDYFEFWGEKKYSDFLDQYPDMYNDPFTGVNVYWFEIADNNGLRIVKESGALININPADYIVPYAYTEKIHFEEDNYFENFGQPSARGDKLSHTLDNWFFDSGISAVGSKSYTAYLPHPLEQGSNSVFLKAMMRGRSYFESRENPIDNHEVEVWLNDKKIAESGQWSNQNLHVLSNEGGLGAAQSDIEHGPNEVRFQLDQIGVSDIVLLNWYEIEYLRKYRADDNFIRFRKQERIPDNYTIQFEIDGFTKPDIELYKLGVSKIQNARIDFYTNPDDNFQSYRISFQDDIFYSGIEYIALTPEQKKKPLKIEQDLPWIPDALTDVSLLDRTNKAEYIIITHEILYNNVLQLKNYREQSGYTVEVVKIQDIYDEFNYGSKSPLAIWDFLKYAYDNWDQSDPLLYVTLVGDADKYYDFRSGSTDMVPTLLYQTPGFGASATDYPFCLVSGDDDIPDLIVSRIPAVNNTDFLNYFNKLTGFEDNQNIGSWRNRLLFISGNDQGSVDNYSDDPVFRAQNQRLIDYNIPEGFFIKKLNTIRSADTSSFDYNFGGKTDLINYIDDGLALINFFGHGGGGVWADVDLFNLEDVDRINNEFKLPFIKSMTCFTGAFENSNRDGLAEKMLKVENRGAIGVLASSGLGYVHNDFAVGWTYTEHLFQDKLSIGEATLFTKIFYNNNNVYIAETGVKTVPSWFSLKRSMIYQYNLLGEPLVKLSLPENSISITVDKKIPVAGDTVKATINTQYASGTIEVELANEKHEQVQEFIQAINASGNTFEFNINPDLEGQILFIKAYATDFNEQSRGLTKIAVSKSLIDSVTVFPSDPQIGDSIYFNVYIQNKGDISKVKIVNLIGNYSYQLNQINETLYTNDTGIGPFSDAGTKFFDIELVDTINNSYLFRNNTLTIKDPRPEIEFFDGSVQFNGISSVGSEAVIVNNSETAVQNLSIALFFDEISNLVPPAYETFIDISPKGKQKISFELDQTELAVGRKLFWIIDRLDLLDEKYENNNIDSSLVYASYLNVPQNLGTTPDGSVNDTLAVNTSAEIYIAPNAISASSTMRMQIEKNPALFDFETQPDFQYVHFAHQSDTAAIQMTLNNKTVQITDPVYLRFVIDTSRYESDFLDNTGLYSFAENIRQWVKIAGYEAGNTISVTVKQLGTFALLHENDDNFPVVEITVNGRNLRDNMLVPANPELAFILQDENGINLSQGLSIKIDGVELQQDDLNFPDNTKSTGAIAIQATPTIARGNHELQVSVSDASGNQTEETIQFVVTGDFDLVVYGNYPNPFTDETYISYNVVSGSLLEDFSVKIYTVSGRLIATLDTRDQKYREPDYHEVYWDGTDDNGNKVANGVYFAIVKAKNDQGKSKEIKLKMAKLK